LLRNYSAKKNSRSHALVQSEALAAHGAWLSTLPARGLGLPLVNGVSRASGLVIRQQTMDLSPSCHGREDGVGISSIPERLIGRSERFSPGRSEPSAPTGLLEMPNFRDGRCMSDKLKISPAVCCRRQLLLTAAAAVGAAATAGGIGSAKAAVKVSASAAGYQDNPNGDKQCSKCVHFLPPNSCKMVDGTISPQGYCRLFSPRQSASVPRRGSASIG
jgi:hypothetical protein